MNERKPIPPGNWKEAGGINRKSISLSLSALIVTATDFTVDPARIRLGKIRG